ncbi:UDP-N-acetylmuramoylalanine--D-glutamate ligase-like isoform X1 [Olea europaea subsp. europaea]|uniref:UDP-N-acetylmuramoylalanine--D-glutamate ligase-like isoform X1 n=1 Tax=Olea europaea subsp. europaea TaxID=158383 RepID=A0A8S0S3P4_OLEEU|nr:UDP-N-acetylmuramoylalanine--D-glutamate ligase-like isoform X1 [Olea europaea subsp. europaea]
MGKRVMSELDFAAEVLPRYTKVLAVTGTNGKSTVATFAGQILHQLNIETFVGRNLGIPLSEATFQCLTSCPKRFLQVAIVEVSSYHLEIPYKFFCPSVAVILNLTPDHLERPKTMENYAMTKCRVFSHMTDKRIAILPLGMKFLSKAIAGHENECNFAWIGAYPGVKIDMEAKIANFEVPTIEHASQLPLGAMKTIGTQNYYNAVVAALSVIGLDLGINDAAIYSTIGNLRAPPHRMEVVHKDSHRITWVDDSKATNVDAMYAELMVLKELKAVVLLGGLAKKTKSVIFFLFRYNGSLLIFLNFIIIFFLASDVQGSNGFEQLVEPLKYHRGVITLRHIPFYYRMMIQNALSSNGLSIPCVRARDLKDAVR